MKFILRIIPVLLFLGLTALAPFIIRDSVANQHYKSDLAEISHIKYGIFSINAWKTQISGIIFGEITKLDLKTTAVKLKATVENQLTAVIDKLNERIRETNRESLGGRIKQLLINIVVDIEDVKRGVPGYADALIAEITKPEAEKQVKELATQQLQAYFDRTFEKQDMRLVDAVLKRTDSADTKIARTKLNTWIKEKADRSNMYGVIFVTLAVLIFAWHWFRRSRGEKGFVLLFPTLLILLAVGVTTPMIDLEAKITEMSFQLLGHKIFFENQILYFQSKSVLDVFWIMITHKDIQMKAVGILMILFSIVFPVFKILSSLAYYYDVKGSRKSKWIDFFVFKSGKWSMADVMVVAIFMAYIGFNGIISNQFGKMKALVPKDIVFLTTNGTALQVGFFVFLTYAILALFLSGFLKTRADEAALKN